MLSNNKRSPSFPLRLSPSALQLARTAAEAEGLSLNHFVSIAVTEKLSRLERMTWIKRQAAMQRETVGLARVMRP